MRRVLLAVVVGLMLAGGAQAAPKSGPSITTIQNQTRLAVNRRLRFVGNSARVMAVRCQTDGASLWFCTVRLSGYGTVYYSVRLSGENLLWTLQH